MIRRLVVRTVIFAFLTVAALLAMQPLTVVTGWPEVLQCMKAAAVLAWAEHSIMIIRLAMQPKLDVQAAAMLASDPPGPRNPVASAIVYATHQATWAVRLGAFLLLYGVL